MDEGPHPGADELYEQAPCGLLLAAADGRVLRMNATLSKWLGRSPGEAPGELLFHELLTVGGRIFWLTHLQPLLRMQGSVAEVKLELAARDGAKLPVMLNAAEQVLDGRTVLHVAMFVAEERHKYEHELLLQRRRAEELSAQHARDEQELKAARAQAEDRALFAEQLVGMVSHDIRNPLSVIHMSAVLLDRGVSPEQQKAALARVKRAAQRVQHLIGDLLDFTQARLGQGLSTRKATCDLHQAVAEGVAELAVAFPERTLVSERSGDHACIADPDRIVQAVGNLVANAATHGDPQRPITVRTESDGATFRVSVHNHGQPIPEAVLPALFQPMVRGAGSGASKGVGLGLYIVREIARAHGGRVDVRSSEAEGTTFALELPCG
jgi:sigma-B regulation protein RsbU (phosphoserine phosphatase)